MNRDPLPIAPNHLLCDLWFESDERLKYVSPLRAALIEAARVGGARVCHSHFHQFTPWGVSGYLLLEESHISLHTWVEERYAALDVYGCGAMDHGAIVDCVVERLRPQQVTILGALRGRSRAQIAAIASHLGHLPYPTATVP